MQSAYNFAVAQNQTPTYLLSLSWNREAYEALPPGTCPGNRLCQKLDGTKLELKFSEDESASLTWHHHNDGTFWTTSTLAHEYVAKITRLHLRSFREEINQAKRNSGIEDEIDARCLEFEAMIVSPVSLFHSFNW